MAKIHIGSDHAGFALKELLSRELTEMGWQVEDHGTNSTQSCDYPLIACALCGAVASSSDPGILVCGTGIGMSIAANRNPGIRAALCGTELAAHFARRHNNANVLCLGARLTGDALAVAIMKAFLESSFEGGRHQRRLEQIDSQ